MNYVLHNLPKAMAKIELFVRPYLSDNSDCGHSDDLYLYNVFGLLINNLNFLICIYLYNYCTHVVVG